MSFCGVTEPALSSTDNLNHEAAASRHGAAAVQLPGHHLRAERCEGIDGKFAGRWSVKHRHKTGTVTKLQTFEQGEMYVFGNYE